jgi:hypothetical protein
VLNIEPPGPDNSGSIAETPNNQALFVGSAHEVISIS